MPRRLGSTLPMRRLPPIGSGRISACWWRATASRRRSQLPPEQWDPRQHGTLVHFIFPNSLIVYHPDYISHMGIFPAGIDRSLFVHTMLTPELACGRKGKGALGPFVRSDRRQGVQRRGPVHLRTDPARSRRRGRRRVRARAVREQRAPVPQLLTTQVDYMVAEDKTHARLPLSTSRSSVELQHKSLNRSADVLQVECPKLLKRKIRPLAHLITHGTRDTNTTRRTLGLKPNRYVNAVTM